MTTNTDVGPCDHGANIGPYVYFTLSWFQGTNIAAGKCRGIVIGTGLNTEIGKSKHVILFEDT